MKNAINSKVVGICFATLAWCCFGLQKFAFAQQACEVITVFPLGDTWSYDDTGVGYTDQAWTAFNFDDSGWLTGPGPFGFGDPWVVTPVQIEQGAYYFRKKFDFSGDASQIKALVMRALFDDGFIVYLNGTEIVRREMPIGPPTPDQFGFEHEVRNDLGEFFDLINPDSSVTIVDKFLPVDNIMAVEVHNVSLTSSDAGFDGGLWYSNDLEIVTPLPLGSTWLRDNTFSDLGTAWREVGFDDSNWVEECAPIGIEDDLPNPVCTELPTSIINGYYFRTKFTIEHDLSLIDSLFVIAQYDDGIQIFINGQELLRGFLGLAPFVEEVTWDTFGSFHDSHPRQVFNVSDQKDLFVKGENLMALTVKQQALTSSDIYMDVGVSYRLCELGTSVDEDTQFGVVPNSMMLRQNYPNPFNPETSITFDIPANHPSDIRLEIFDLLGRKVRTLASGRYAPGTYSVTWNATDDAGLRVASGIYVYRLSSPSRSVTKKMLLIQ